MQFILDLVLQFFLSLAEQKKTFLLKTCNYVFYLESSMYSSNGLENLSSSRGMKNKRIRTIFTPEQLELMEEEFHRYMREGGRWRMRAFFGPCRYVGAVAILL